ncbi:hypothetical protein [Gracilibacillus boraciitolerans]|nr:hypothetical protein [Gracilibacillus boraciitolerans]
MKKLLIILFVVFFTVGFYFIGTMATVESESLSFKKAVLSEKK